MTDVERDRPTLDLHVIEGIRSLEGPKRPTFTQDMIELFMLAAEAALPRLAEFAIDPATPNHEGLKKLAHRLKGAGLSIGALRFASFCQKIEDHPRAEMVVALQPELEDEYRAVVKALATIKTKSAPIVPIL